MYSDKAVIIAVIVGIILTGLVMMINLLIETLPRKEFPSMHRFSKIMTGAFLVIIFSIIWHFDLWC